MTFSEFANRLGRVIRSESSTATFTRTLFEAILPEDRLDVLNEYKISSYKAFYNGNSNITNIAKKINKYAQKKYVMLLLMFFLKSLVLMRAKFWGNYLSQLLMKRLQVRLL